jgi:serine/threonine protein kinase
VIRLFETIESPKRIHIVMEYLSGSNLCNYVKSKRRLEEDEARVIFSQILESMQYIHALNIVHRDIKLEVSQIHPILTALHSLIQPIQVYYQPHS